MNPWLILGAVLFWGASITVAFFQGESREADRAKAEYSKKQDQAIREANEDAFIDMQAAREVGAREARARVNTVYIKGKAEVIFRDNPQPPLVCDWKPDAFGVLNDAIKAANDLTGSAQPVPDTRPAIKPAQ